MFQPSQSESAKSSSDPAVGSVHVGVGISQTVFDPSVAAPEEELSQQRIVFDGGGAPGSPTHCSAANSTGTMNTIGLLPGRDWHRDA